MKTAMQLTAMLAMSLAIIGQNESRLSDEWKSAYAKQQIKVVNTIDIHRTEITDVGSTYELIDVNTIKTRGKSDFNKNVLTSDTVKIYTSLRIGFDSTQDESGKEAELSYKQALPFSFRNARLRIEQGGVLMNLPISELVNPNTGATRTDDYVDLELPVVLVGNTEFKMSLEFPVGATKNAIKKEYLEIALKGVETTRSLAA